VRNRALGLDLGQAQDHTALALVEWTDNDDGERVYALRHLERLPLGTGYPAVTAHVKELMHSDELALTTTLVVDSTGVGRGVVDFLRHAGLRPVPVVVHAGRQSTVDDLGYHNVPKRLLVGLAQVLLQDRRLKFGKKLPHVKLLEEELLRFEVKITDAGTDTYGAWREGAHDDLVFALCLGVWFGEHRAGPLVPVRQGYVTRLTTAKPTEDTRARRAILGRGVDPKSSGLVVGRNGAGRY
jgi:hypothetical protein